jgi:aldehyde:ferredoxin oxidoreductase
MPDGFFGRVLLVDLSQDKVDEEALPGSVYEAYLGGQGLGVRLLYDRLPRGTDALGAENILGFFPGLLTGTGVPFSGRFMVVGKSPLTKGWGECNCGGHFGPVLRGAGFDGLLITGSSPRPVYLHIEDDQVELREANHLWGLNTVETGQRLKDKLGRAAQVVSIGPAGEKRSLMAGIFTDDGRAAARSGLGAVMGAKRLKAIAVRGSRKLPVFDEESLTHLNREYAQIFKDGHNPLPRLIPQLSQLLLPVLRRLPMRLSGGPAEAIVQVYREYGTCFGIPFSTAMGDAPVQNWRGVAARDFPLARSERVGGDAVLKYQTRRYHCSRCPVGCGGVLRLEGGGNGVRESRKVEFETLAAFGPLLLNDDLESIIEIGSLCDRYGLDTISVGSTVAFSLECAEQGLIRPEEVGGLELSWGDARAIMELVRLIGRREGFGDLLADGVKRAAERLGKGSEALAMHAGGQELPMHDPRYEPLLGLAYAMDPTPGRHNTANGGVFDVASLREIYAMENLSPGGRYQYERKGPLFALLNRYLQVVNCAGLCMFSLLMGKPPIPEWINAATGWDLRPEDLLRIGHRIQVLRQAFNLREGIRPGDFSLPPRVRGHPPLEDGTLKGITLGMETMTKEYFRAMGYDELTGTPTATLLESLGLPDVAEDLKGVGG